MLDVTRLERPRLRGRSLIARCPACAEAGADRSCEHLFIADEGRGPFGCLLFQGDSGHAHRRRIFELAGEFAKPHVPQFRSGRPASLKPKPPLRMPTLRTLTVGEMAAIADHRGWRSFAGLELLSRRELLWGADVFDDGREWPAWVIADGTRCNAQARRIDGKPWHGIGDKKAKSLPGSDPSWPIGAESIGVRPFVVLCEGQPDFCAALLVAWFEGVAVEHVAPVCITGAGNAIHTDALHHFAGKHVRIAVHADEAGRTAGKSWARQLYDAGAGAVDGFDFANLTKKDGVAVKDLADFASLIGDGNPPTIQVFEGFSLLRNGT